MAEGIMVVFDFDKTIIDCDSDNWVIEELGATDLFNQLLPTMPWNTLMDTMMKELHSQGKTIEDIVDVLKRIPIHPCIIPAIKAVHAQGCDLKIVSDANHFFIETILKHYEVMEYFSEIKTNPAGFVDQKEAAGRLRIFPHHDFTKSPHGCHLCPPNMCKGLVMERIIQDNDQKKKIIYLGDGNGDFCPSLKLSDNDCVMPRKNFPLWELICKNNGVIKAEIREWTDGEELEIVLLGLIKLFNSNNNIASSVEDKKMSSVVKEDLISADNCKLETVVTVVADDVLSQPLIRISF